MRIAAAVVGRVVVTIVSVIPKVLRRASQVYLSACVGAFCVCSFGCELHPAEFRAALVTDTVHTACGLSSGLVFGLLLRLLAELVLVINGLLTPALTDTPCTMITLFWFALF